MPEQPRDESGQFAPSGSAAPAGQTAGATTAPEKKYTLKVDGQVREFTADELLASHEAEVMETVRKGLTWTQRMQRLAEEKQQLESERAALQRPPGGFQSGLDESGSTAPPSAALYGGWGEPSGDVYGPGEEPPAQGRPAERRPAPIQAESEDDEFVARRDVRRLENELRTLKQQATRTQAMMEMQRREQMQDALIAGMQRTIPGFDPAKVEEQFYLLSPQEQAQYRSMPKSVAFELMHWRHVAPQNAQLSAARQGTTTPEGAAEEAPEEEEAPPFAEGVKGSGPQQPPQMPSTLTGADKADVARLWANHPARKKATVARSR
jgi:hypothetical protein